ncbi:leucine-rich repeat-containing protein 34-like [Dermacentor albipictus]|uniref:leucine-rich repeat-containing protein 34-like n=1 Tax=Dermacentor albipictus TaxID=60249 RepID=UPI0038FC34A4
MSGDLCEDPSAEGVELSDVLKKGLRASADGDACSGTVGDGDVVAKAMRLEYKADLSVDEARVLRRAFSTEGFVKRLKLFGVPLNVCKIVLEDLDESSSLEELELFGIESEEEEFSVNLSGIFGNLRVLHLSCSEIGDHFAMDVAFFLQDNFRLEELSLWSNEISDDGASSLAEALTINGTLKKLVLANNTLTSRTVVAFADTLTVNSSLEMVDIFEVDLEEEDVQVLFQDEKYADTFKRMYILWKQNFLPHLTRLLREDRHCADVSVDVTESVSEDDLREFFDAVATNTTARTLHFYPSGKMFDALTDGLVSVLQRTTTLTRVQNLMAVDRAETLVRVLDALRENRSVTTFSMYAELVTPEIAASLSELLATNDVLNDVNICENYGIRSEELAVVLEGLRQNYTVTHLMVAWDPDDDVEGVSEMAELLDRNVRLLDRAVEFVRAGGAEVNDEEGADALKKVRSSACLIDKLQKITGKTKEAVVVDVEDALNRVEC